MKISGKFILKVAGTLTVIALVVAALLGVVNNVTKDKIAEQDAENTRIAMSAVADGKVQIARALGQSLPPGCILDRDGRPSQDPEDYFHGGVLLPFGAHKGFGLAVMVECLAGILSGAGMLDEIDSWNERPGVCGNTGHLIAALDISKMMPLEDFCSRVEELILRIRSAKPAEGVDAIHYPGELEHLRAKAAGDSVALLPAATASLEKAAEIAGVKLHSL